MALRFPARTRSATSTTGLGTYTLAEPTSAGWRNFTRAVVDGDLADADQVGYAVVDTTVDGGPKLIEVGLGTYDDAAKTLTRDTVYQPNGSAVDWGAGTRDVIVLDLPQIAVWLTGDQTIAGEKTFSDKLRAVLGGTPAAGDSATPLIVQNSGSATTDSRLAIIAGNAGDSTLNLGDTDNQYIGGIIYDHGAESMVLRTGGATRVSLDSAAAKFTPPVQDASGNPYAKEFPAGGRLLWGSSTIPSGWAIVAGLADKTILLTSTAGEIDDTGGSWTISGLSAGNTTLTLSQIPAHSHDLSLNNGGGGSSGVLTARGEGFVADDGTQDVSTEGGGGAHTHTVSQDGSWRPSYQKWGAIQKS